MAKFPTLKPKIEQKWLEVANASGISPDTYHFDAKVVESQSGDFSFGIFRNSHRFQRPQQKKSSNPTDSPFNCPLCVALDDIVGKPERHIIHPDILDVVIIPNKFPTTIGHTLAITKDTGKYETPMYKTSDLASINLRRKLASEMDDLVKFADETGFRLYHNSADAGASITSHEHWHLTNFATVHNATGRRYGFDDADIESVNSTQEVSYMPAFPFAHLIFSQDNPDRVFNFLSRLGYELGSNYDDRSVPHGIAQGEENRGLLVVPAKNKLAPGLPGIGSGDMAGHIPVKTQEDFDATDYDACITKLNQRLYKASEMDLTKFL